MASKKQLEKRIEVLELNVQALHEEIQRLKAAQPVPPIYPYQPLQPLPDTYPAWPVWRNAPTTGDPIYPSEITISEAGPAAHPSRVTFQPCVTSDVAGCWHGDNVIGVVLEPNGSVQPVYQDTGASWNES